MFGFLDVPVSGAYHLVHWLVLLTQPVAGTLAVALAIILFTAAVRLLLLPLAKAAVRGEKARAVLMPQIKQLQAKHANDKDRLAGEITKLQQESGTSFFVGCLPMLAQLPFFWVMYRLFSAPTVGGGPNSLLTGTLFGTPLNAHLTAAPVFFGLAAALALVAWFSVRWQDRQRADAPPVPGGALMRYLPYGSVLAVAFIPLAAALYLLTTTAWTVTERAVLRR